MAQRKVSRITPKLYKKFNNVNNYRTKHILLPKKKTTKSIINCNILPTNGICYFRIFTCPYSNLLQLHKLNIKGQRGINKCSENALGKYLNDIYYIIIFILYFNISMVHSSQRFIHMS